MDRHEKFTKMTTQPVGRLVCEFAVPSMVCMLVSAFYNIVDTYFVGRIDTQSTAALGIVFSYMAIIQAVSFFFGHGSGNFISRALGAQKSEQAETMASTGFFTAIALTTLIAVFGFLLMEPVLTLFGSTPTIMPRAKEYFVWILTGTPFISGVFVMNNQMRLQGNASMSMIGVMIGAALNIALDPLFIFTLDMGIAGAGMATALSQMVSFVIMLKMIGLRGGICLRLRNFKPSAERYAEIFAGGSPSLVRQCLMAVVSICLNNYASRYGDSAVAAFSVVGRIMMFATAALLGFGQGFQPVCGFNYGAGLFPRVSRTFRFSLAVSTAYCMAVAIGGILFAETIVSLFSAADSEVISLGALVLKFHCYSYGLNGFIVLTNMYLQNTRKTAAALLVATARQGLFFLPLLVVGAHFFDMTGIIAAQPLSDVLTFVLAVIINLHSHKKADKL